MLVWPGQVFARHRAGHAAGRSSKKTEAVDDGRNLVFQCARIRFATVERFEARKLLGALLNRIGHFQQQARSLHWRGLAPAVERPAGAEHGLVDLLEGGLGHLHDHFARGRVEHALGLALTGHELAVDEQLGVTGPGPGSRGSFPWWSPLG